MVSKTLVITGANGYLGKHTIRAAISDGWSVIGIVRRNSAAKEVESLGATAITLEKFEGNSLRKAFTDCKAIIHFRGVACGEKELFERINIQGMKILVKAAKEMHVPRIIFPSGLGIDKFGEIEWATNEYFRSKMEAEQILKESGVPFIIFRPSYILGPNDELIPDLIEQIGDGTVYIAGEGDVTMQPIFVEDAIKAFLSAADGKGEDNQIFDLVGPEITNMNEIVSLILNTMKKFGFNIPFPRILKIPYEEAPDHLEVCKEMIDVMRCDVVSDGNFTANALSFTLSGLSEAVKSSVMSKMFPEQIKSEKKAIILLSGGIDSATTLFWAKKEGYDLTALSFNYHLRPEKERMATLKLAEIVGID
ncbi:MAG: NAD-dependent epimerase/dehydratase family protein, partial [Promethearchaeota archaeon]